MEIDREKYELLLQTAHGMSLALNILEQSGLSSDVRLALRKAVRIVNQTPIENTADHFDGIYQNSKYCKECKNDLRQN